jgi:hypothetical protein
MRAFALFGFSAAILLALACTLEASLVRLPVFKVNTVRRHLIEMDGHFEVKPHLRRYDGFHGFPEPLSNYMGKCLNQSNRTNLILI